MTEVMSSLEPEAEDFSGVGRGGDQATIFPDSHERYPKLSKRLPSIVVESTDGAQVESGELRWPPDEPSSPDTKPERQIAKEQDDTHSDVCGADSSQEVSGTETQESN